MLKLLILVLCTLAANISGNPPKGTTFCGSVCHNAVINFDGCTEGEMCFQRQGEPREVELRFKSNDTFKGRGAFLKVDILETVKETSSRRNKYNYYGQRETVVKTKEVPTTLIEDQYICDFINCPIETNTTYNFSIPLPNTYTSKAVQRTTLKLKFSIENWDKQKLVCAERNLFIIKPQWTDLQ